MQTVVRCSSSEKSNCKKDTKYSSPKKKSKLHETPTGHRRPESPQKLLSKCVLQEVLRTSGYSKLSASSTAKHPKTIEATFQQKKEIDLLTPAQKAKKQGANVLLKQKKKHFISKEYSPVLLKQGLKRTPTDGQARQVVPFTNGNNKY